MEGGETHQWAGRARGKGCPAPPRPRPQPQHSEPCGRRDWRTQSRARREECSTPQARRSAAGSSGCCGGRLSSLMARRCCYWGGPDGRPGGNHGQHLLASRLDNLPPQQRPQLRLAWEIELTPPSLLSCGPSLGLPQHRLPAWLGPTQQVCIGSNTATIARHGSASALVQHNTRAPRLSASCCAPPARAACAQRTPPAQEGDRDQGGRGGGGGGAQRREISRVGQRNRVSIGAAAASHPSGRGALLAAAAPVPSCTSLHLGPVRCVGGVHMHAAARQRARCCPAYRTGPKCGDVHDGTGAAAAEAAREGWERLIRNH